RSDWDYRFSVPKEGIDEVRGFVASLKECRVPIAQAESKLRRLYKERRFDRAITLYNCLDDEYRVWGKINLSWPNANSVGPSYDVLHPVTKQKVAVPDRGWRWKRETFEALVDYANVVQRHDGSYVCGKIWFDATEATQPSLIKYLDDVDRVLLKSIISTKSDGGIEVERLFGQKNVMSYPKPTSLL